MIRVNTSATVGTTATPKAKRILHQVGNGVLDQDGISFRRWRSEVLFTPIEGIQNIHAKLG